MKTKQTNMKILSNSIFLPLAFLAFVVAGQPSATLVADGVDVSSKHHLINDDAVASIDNNSQGRSLRGTTNGGNIGGTTAVTTTKFDEEIMRIIGSSHRELGSNCNGDCSSKRDRFKDCTETSHGNWVCQKKKSISLEKKMNLFFNHNMKSCSEASKKSFRKSWSKRK